MNAFQVVRDFEKAVCEYTGAPYCVAVNSCTAAIFLALTRRYQDSGTETVTIPKRTYVSVPMQILHCGSIVDFEDMEWRGSYQLKPTPIWDSARRFTSGMYIPGQVQCVSFHVSKILGLDQGGAILHDDPEADRWYRKARFDGRTEGVPPKADTFDALGYHCYLSPPIAAQGIWRINTIPRHNEDLPNDDYPDLSKIPLFR